MPNLSGCNCHICQTKRMKNNQKRRLKLKGSSKCCDKNPVKSNSVRGTLPIEKFKNKRGAVPDCKVTKKCVQGLLDDDQLELFPTQTDPCPAMIVQPMDVTESLVIGPQTQNGSLGFISAEIPDNTAVGGNCRGVHAVDFQMNRSAADQVASGVRSAIITGQNNLVSGSNSIVGAGLSNQIVSSEYSGILAGQGNLINPSPKSAILAGSSNSIQNDFQSAILAGYRNLITGSCNSQIGAGHHNTIDGQNCFIGAGTLNGMTGTDRSLIGAGSCNTIENSNYSGILVGRSNKIASSIYGNSRSSTIISGEQNTLSGSSRCMIGSGQGNTMAGSRSIIGAGQYNTMTDENSIIGAGSCNYIAGEAITGRNCILSGTRNSIKYGSNSFIGAGTYNGMTGIVCRSAILAGQNNSIISAYGVAIVGGDNNTISSGAHYSVILGGTGMSADGTSQIKAGGTFFIKAVSNASDSNVLTWDSTTKEVKWRDQGGISSDERLKRNLSELPVDFFDLDVLTQMKLIKYQEKRSAEDAPYKYGFSAQNLQQHLPWAVKDTYQRYQESTGHWVTEQKEFLDVDVMAMIQYLTGVCRQLHEQNQDQQRQLDELRTRVFN